MGSLQYNAARQLFQIWASYTGRIQLSLCRAAQPLYTRVSITTTNIQSLLLSSDNRISPQASIEINEGYGIPSFPGHPVCLRTCQHLVLVDALCP